MAQDNGAVANSNQDVDIDDLEVDILIICKNPSSLKQASAFLGRRGWPTKVIGNISEAVEYIAEKRPDFVLISFNHNSPAVQKLPDLITQTFNLVCIGFMEQTDALSTQKLTQIKMRNKVFGQPSGPNIQRTIRRILAEKFNVRLDERGTQEDVSAGKNATVTVRGANKEKAGSVAIRRADSADGRDSLGAMSGAEGGSSSGAKEGKAQKSQVIIQKAGQALTAEKGAAVFSGPGQGRTLSAAQEPSVGSDSGEVSLETTEAAEFETSQPVDNGKVHRLGEIAEGKGNLSPKGKARKSLKQLTGVEKATKAAGNLMLGENLDPNLPEPAVGAEDSTQDLVGMLKKSLFGDDLAGEVSPQSVLEKAAESALKSICESTSEVAPTPLEMVNLIVVFPLDSATSPGYLVLAMEAPPSTEKKTFLGTCENALQTAVKNMGVEGKIETGFWVDLPKIPFDLWVVSQAKFNLKLDYRGAEIGVAFFQTEKQIPKTRSLPDAEMVTIDLAEIPTEHPLNFKAYLHLQKNEKYVLYLRDGRILQTEKKKRLQENNVTAIFMKTADVENLRIFLAEAFLKESIKLTGYQIPA